MALLLIAAVCFLAWSNGANDNFKGVASLYGCRAAGYRGALTWATVTTLAGSLAALVLAEGLMKKFGGKGLVPDELAGTAPFLLTVSLGAGLTVLLATWRGLPISTTHALLGAMLGAGSMAAKVNPGVLGKSFFLPLLLSPLLAIGMGASIYLSFRWLRLRLGIGKEWCLCIGETKETVPIPQPASVFALQASPPLPSVTLAETADCHERYAGHWCGIRGQHLMDAAHFASAGTVCFARGLNDTPKIAALMLAVPEFRTSSAIAAVAVAMATGGILGAKRVASTMSHKITVMNHGQGFSANAGTGILVTLASLWGLPVSTTHVSVGALTGIGLVNRKADFRMLGKILLSWLVTLPCAAILGAVLWFLIDSFF